MNEASKAIVAPREYLLELLFAANERGIFGVSNMCGLVLNNMQPFLLMQKMITLEEMIELAPQAFLARRTASPCVPRTSAPPSPALFLRPWRAVCYSSAVCVRLGCVGRADGRRRGRALRDRALRALRGHGVRGEGARRGGRRTGRRAHGDLYLAHACMRPAATTGHPTRRVTPRHPAAPRHGSPYPTGHPTPRYILNVLRGRHASARRGADPPKRCQPNIYTSG